MAKQQHKRVKVPLKRADNPKEYDRIIRARYYKRNKARVTNRQSEKRKSDPEYYRARTKKWQEQNPDKVKKACRSWRAQNPEKQAQACKNWERKNPMRRSELTRKRRAAKYGVEEHFTPYMRGKVRKQFNRTCFRCGATRRLHIDHHLPLSLGHALAYGNAVILCIRCNAAKGVKLPQDFYTREQLAILSQMLVTQKTWSIGK